MTAPSSIPAIDPLPTLPSAHSGTLRVAVLGHWGGNIGHDMMATGVEAIIGQALQARPHDLVRIEQHRPFDIYPKWLPLRYLDHQTYLTLIRPSLMIRDAIKHAINRPWLSSALWRANTLSGANLAIACGGPYFVNGVHKSSQIALMLHHLHGAFSSHGVPVLNLSVGSCYPWTAVPRALADPADRAFVLRTIELARCTTVRDRVTAKLLSELGADCPQIPCPALVGGRTLETWQPALQDLPRSGYVLVSFRRVGGGAEWGQAINTEGWVKTIGHLAERLSGRREAVFICHSQEEMDWAAQVAPAHRRYYPKSLQQYAELLTGARAGLVNRIHAGIALASAGRPVVGVGTDTRLETLAAMGLRVHFVNDVNADLLETELEDLMSQQQSEFDRLHELRDQTAGRYVQLIQETLGRTHSVG